MEGHQPSNMKLKVLKVRQTAASQWVMNLMDLCGCLALMVETMVPRL